MSALPTNEPATDTHEGELVDIAITARSRDLGGFSVRRVLPAIQRRSVGPFVFFDHMGPAKMDPGQGMDVRPHPHIALATVTYLFDGQILHRDSLGNRQIIAPGEVNFMVAGRGIVHSERSPDEARRTGATLHGIQTWMALPLDDEETEPRFDHHGANTIPIVERDGVRLAIVLGSAYGGTSPVRVLSKTLYVDAALPAGATLVLPGDVEERAVYVAEGAIVCDGKTFEAGTMLVAKPTRHFEVGAERPSRLMVIGGRPLGERHVFWNFVSSSKERIERAKADWKAGRFPKVPGDDVEFIPLPE
jgi:hypothetical protein